MKNQNPIFSLLITGSNSCIPDIKETELHKKKLVVTRITNHENTLNHIANFEYNLVFITIENETIEVEKAISSIHSSSKNKNILVVLGFLFQPQKKLLNRLNRQIVTDVILLDDNNNILLEKIDLYKHLSIKLDELKNENNLLKKEVFTLKDQNNKLEFNAKKDKKTIQKAYEELSSELDQNINSLIEINTRNVLLEEKLSQLNCLNSISKQSENESLSLPHLLKQITDIIANSLSFSDCLYTDILYDGISYKSDDFELTNQKHKTNILYQGKKTR